MSDNTIKKEAEGVLALHIRHLLTTGNYPVDQFIRLDQELKLEVIAALAGHKNEPYYSEDLIQGLTSFYTTEGQARVDAGRRRVLSLHGL